MLAVTGLSWMDHEFFTGSMAPDLVGWDWFALQLADGWEVMLYLLRHRGRHRGPGLLRHPHRPPGPGPGP